MPDFSFPVFCYHNLIRLFGSALDQTTDACSRRADAMVVTQAAKKCSYFTRVYKIFIDQIYLYLELSG